MCGLEWSPDGAFLASGGNDNKLCIWSATHLSAAAAGSSNGNSTDDDDMMGGGTSRATSTISKPLHRFSAHTAAVKALAWCPHQSGLLASGGGTADKCIRFWNASTGLLLGAVDTGSQVCQLAWSPMSMELLSAHGYSTNSLVLWRYPSMTRMATLTGHTTRVLYLTVAPGGDCVCTGAGDETIRFWRIFKQRGNADNGSGSAGGVGGLDSNTAGCGDAADSPGLALLNGGKALGGRRGISSPIMDVR